MPRTYRPSTKKPYKKYDELAIKAALSDYKNSQCTLAEIGRKHGISKSVLFRHNTRIMKKHGGQTVFSSEVEDYLVGILNHCSEWGYPLDTYDLRLFVKSYLDRVGLVVRRFRDNLPGPDFVKAFLQRHKSEIKVKICRKRIKNRTTVSSEMIEEYFKDLGQQICNTEAVKDSPSNYDNSDQRIIYTDTERFSSADPLEDKAQSNDDDLDENEFDCTNIEYLEEDAVFDSSDDTADDITEYGDHAIIKQEETPALTNPAAQQDLKLTLDDIDHLFLSYAHTFRTLAKQSQTMLKLDLAKLFAHYEMENTSLSTQKEKNPEKYTQPLVEKPSTLLINLYPEKTSQSIPSVEEQSETVQSISKDIQKKPRIKQQQIIRKRRKQFQCKENEINTTTKLTHFKNSAKLKRLKANCRQQLTPLLSPTPLPANTKYLPDLQMKVSEPVYSETVFVTDNVSLTEDET